MALLGKAHKFGDDISADIHVFDKHSIFKRQPGDDGIADMAKTMLARLDPEFPARRRPGDFIVAGEHFGTLSMYDQSAAIIRAAGIAAVLARSFNDLFVRHAVNRGLLLIECDTDEIRTGDELVVDVERAIVQVPARGLRLTCRVPPGRIRAWLAEGGVIEHIRRKGGF